MMRFVGMGACGSRIALQIEKMAKTYGLSPKVFYMNFDQIDMKELKDIGPKRKLLLSGSGTGRTPQAGEELAIQHRKEISEFLKTRLNRDDVTILLFGAGGGTGSGLAPVVAEVLEKMKFQYGAAVTFPDKTSDFVVNQNAIYTLNRIMEHAASMKPLILVDNEYLSENLKHQDNDWWGKVNKYIANAFLSMLSLVNPDDDRVSSEKGIGNLDWGEVKRALHVDGLADIRLIQVPAQALMRPDYIQKEFREKVVKESLCGKYPLKDTLAYSGGVILPAGFNALDKCQEMFNVIAELTPSAAIRRWGTIFKSAEETAKPGELQYVRLVMISSGYKLPNDINKKIKAIQKDSQKFIKTRDKKSKVDLASGLGPSLDIGNSFKI